MRFASTFTRKYSVIAIIAALSTSGEIDTASPWSRQSVITRLLAFGQRLRV
ncbi:hypothetical protein [Limimonas halophila]|uniref:hypothetical protein n=1 Tax=Limimonas halophila TaxID=1082479 RepID=UPI0015A15EAE|nr:hypothetical protein [Limimonas halophila]